MPRFTLADSAVLVLDEVSALLRAEVRLLKAELKENVANLRNGIVLLSAAAILGLLALGELLDAAVGLLVELGFGLAASSAIVGVSVLLLALLLGWLGSRRLSARSLTPERSLEALKGRPGQPREARE